jgi:hypothetical protein
MTATTDAGTDAPTGTLDTGSDDPDAPVAIDAPSGTDTGGEDDAGVTPPDDAPILSAFDTGDPFGDAGTLGPPVWVPIDVLTMGTCDDFTPCGGDVLGTWDVTGACVEVPIPDALFMCPGATAEGVGMARGRVTFDGTIAWRTAQSVVEVEVFVPTLCATIAGGCDNIETMLQSNIPDSACAMDTTGCRCLARQQFDIDDADGYTIDTATNEIVSATLMKRWEYCVGGSTLTYRDSSPSGSSAPREEGTIELGMR